MGDLPEGDTHEQMEQFIAQNQLDDNCAQALRPRVLSVLPALKHNGLRFLSRIRLRNFTNMSQDLKHTCLWNSLMQAAGLRWASSAADRLGHESRVRSRERNDPKLRFKMINLVDLNRSSNMNI